jgi:hypothetical protein
MTQETRERFIKAFRDDAYLDDWVPERKKEETNVMDLANIKVVVGSKEYIPNDVDWIQTPYSYPRLRLDVSINPNTKPQLNYANNLTIKNVIFNPPATIVFWSDNTKTVVKNDCRYEIYDPEKGLAMAISKKMLGDNKYEYYNIFLHWLKKWDKQHPATIDDFMAPGEWNGDMSSI